MKLTRLIGLLLLVVTTLAMGISSVLAAKPQPVIEHSNGYPSGSTSTSMSTARRQATHVTQRPEAALFSSLNTVRQLYSTFLTRSPQPQN